MSNAPRSIDPGSTNASVGSPGAPDTDGKSLPDQVAPAGNESKSADRWMSEIGTLLRELQNVSTANAALPPIFSEAEDNKLVQVRLGMASSLFAALRCKHAATAGHTLRVALTCSSWALRMGLDPKQRDVIEVAALLHDVGVIGVPDRILLKPGALSADEATVITQSRHKSLEILRHSCASREVLDAVEYVPAWYNGARPGFKLSGDELPLAARMIAIAEAFDAMTTDHVYRKAMSQERAMTELFDCADTQFDPVLVERFAELCACDASQLHREVAGRWLLSLDPELVSSHWQLNCDLSPTVASSTDTLFQEKLLENMYDAVVFISTSAQVMLWNRGAERLTGITGSSVARRQWHPDLLKMADEKGNPVDEADCPVLCVIRTGVQSLRRLTICGPSGRAVSVDTHIIPVIAEDGTMLGAILLFHDASSETSLEQRCQNLYEKSTKDPLTQVANRAEFDRVHEMFVIAHQRQQVPCSLIIGDLDRFKLVNDTWGHQAGDAVIKSVATLLKGSCRPGDLVARYGGEEFVVLCADCDNATATRRAENIRQALSQMPQPQMNGRPAHVSFGVTEIQPGDTAETMLRRADRALLMAKSNGRNRVVQLGTGSDQKAQDAKTRFWPLKTPRADKLLEQTLVTPVPVRIAVEKLRGFVADHEAKIIKVDGNNVRLRITDKKSMRRRRRNDRPVTFRVDLQFEEERLKKDVTDLPSDGVSRTRIYVSISPNKNRDRRRDDVSKRAGDVLLSFRSYLMAAEEAGEPPEKTTSRAKRILGPWLAKKR